MTVTLSEADAALFAEHPDLPRLLGALRRASGFALYFARCNSPAYRRRLVDALLSRLDRPVLLFELDNGSTDSLDARVEKALQDSSADAAVFVFDLENFLPSSDPDRQAQTLSELNWHRGAFARLGHPLVFWLPEWALNILACGAPDFYDWYSGVYEFNFSEPARYEQFDTALAATNSPEAMQRLTFEEKLRWSEVLKELIAEADYETGGDACLLSSLLNKYGVLAANLGNYAEALAVFERALKLDEVVYGPNSPEVAVLSHNYGSVLQNVGDLEGAKAACERALAIDEATYGVNHSTVASDFNSLGSILEKEGDLVGAKAYFERAANIHEIILGPTHPFVANDLNNIGNVQLLLDNTEEAKPLLERALMIAETAYGNEHLVIASILNNLGNVLKSLGDFQGARLVCERALGICRKFLGERHPDTVLVQTNLNKLLAELRVDGQGAER